MTHFKILSAAIVSFLGCTGAAYAENWLCKMDGQRGGSWIGEQVFIAVDPTGTRAVAANAATLHFMKEPQPFEIGKNNNTLIKGHWDLDQIKDSTGARSGGMRFGVVLNKTRKQVNVTATEKTYGTVFTAVGKCALVEK